MPVARAVTGNGHRQTARPRPAPTEEPTGRRSVGLYECTIVMAMAGLGCALDRTLSLGKGLALGGVGGGVVC